GAVCVVGFGDAPAWRACAGGAGDAVHGFAGGVPGGVEPLERAAGHCCWDADCRTDAASERGADRVVREHAGAADGPERGSDVPRLAGAGKGVVEWGLCAPVVSVREAGGGASASARPVAAADLPGAVCVAERAAGAALAGPGVTSAAGGPDGCGGVPTLS